MSEEAIKKFRQRCVEVMVGNTCDNIYDTGNSVIGMTIPDVASYYLVNASYYEGDLWDVANELSMVAELCSDSDHGLSDEDLKVASGWDDEDIKNEVVHVLRQMTGRSTSQDLLLRCCDVIEGLFDDACPWPEMSALLDEVWEHVSRLGIKVSINGQSDEGGRW